MTAEREPKALAMDSLSVGKDLKSFPLRDTSLHRLLPMYASERNPSHFNCRAREMQLKPKQTAAALIKATEVMILRV